MDISEGKILLDGRILHKDIKVLPNLRIIIENAGLYPELTGFENLKLLAKLNHKIGENEIRRTIEKVELDSNDKRKFRKYSLGIIQEEKQRGALILIASHNKEDISILADEVYHINKGTIFNKETV